MKVAVYDRYWSTGGGGEKFAAGIAAALAADHDVRLLAHEAVDTGWLGERLHLDLSGVGVDVQADDAGACPRASAAYDLLRQRLVSELGRQPGPPRAVRRPLPRSGAGSRRAGPARRSPTGRRRAARRRAGRRAGRRLLHARVDPAARHPLDRAATPTLPSPSRHDRSGPVPVVVLLGRFVPAAGGAGRGRGRGRRRRRRTGDGRPRRRSRARPAAQRGAGLHRRRAARATGARRPAQPVLGAQPSTASAPTPAARRAGHRRARRWRAGGRGVARAAPTLWPGRNRARLPRHLRPHPGELGVHPGLGRAALGTATSDVLHPPGHARAPGREGARHPVGRAASSCPAPATTRSSSRWSRPSAGSCERRGRRLGVPPGRRLRRRSTAAYLDQIRAAAEGLPVVLHPDATGAELRALYGRASIFWHAAGLGEDTERHPDRYEHFGITTVEAMSAGAVPVVIDAAGQVEIVEQGVSGYRFAGLDGLRGPHRAADRRPGLAGHAVGGGRAPGRSVRVGRVRGPGRPRGRSPVMMAGRLL